MTKQQGDTIATRRKPQPTIDDFREKFQKFRDAHPVEKFDEAFLDIIQQAAYKGKHIPYELADGMFYFRFLRYEFQTFVWTTSYSLVTIDAIARKIGQMIDFDSQPFDITIGSMLQAATERGELSAPQIANMLSTYQDVRSILYMVSLLEPEHLA